MLYSVPTIGLAMPTDQEWGRLYKFNGTGDAGLIMPPRSYYFRDFVAGGWSNVAMGLIFCNNNGTSGGDTSNVVNERLSEDAVVNLPHFGLSKSVGGVIDPSSNANFIGLRGALGGVCQLIASSSTLGAMLMTLVHGGADNTNGVPIQLKINYGVSSTPFAIMGIRFIYDAATHKVYMFYDSDNGIALADDAANQTTLNAYLDAIPSDITTATASFSLPEGTADFSSYYIFWPYLVNRLKLHCVGMKKYA